VGPEVPRTIPRPSRTWKLTVLNRRIRGWQMSGAGDSAGPRKDKTLVLVAASRGRRNFQQNISNWGLGELIRVETLMSLWHRWTASTGDTVLRHGPAPQSLIYIGEGRI